MRFDIDLSDWRLALADGLVRLPPRNKAMRSARFEDRYDTRTVLYDAFWDTDGRSVIAIAAPLLNLVDDLALTVTALPSGTPCAVRHEEWPKFDRLLVDPPAGTVALVFETPLGRVVRTIQPNLATALADARMIYTLQKDNDLLWIRDWALFYVREHGADTVVLYDNGSTRYEPAEIANALASVQGLANVVVVPWTFPYGAFDLREERSLHCIDGIFCQVAAFHHVRWRLAGRAAGFVNADIDELVVRRGDRTLFDALAGSENGCVEFSGYWVENVRQKSESAPETRRHRDYAHVAAPLATVAETKWATVPSRLPQDAALMVHSVYNACPTPCEDMTLYHFRGINVMWDADRAWHPPRAVEITAGDAFRRDPVLEAGLRRSFADDDGPAVAVRPASSPGAGALLARLRSAEAARSGNMPRAVACAEAAVRAAPEMPSYREHLAALVADPDRAARLTAEAKALREADWGHHFQAAERAGMEERWADMIEALRRSLALFPNNPLAVRRMLLALVLLERYAEAEELIQSSIDRIDPPHTLVADALTLYTKTKRWADAEALVRRAMARCPDDAGLDVMLAAALIPQRKIEAAREAVARARQRMTPEWFRRQWAGVQKSNTFAGTRGRIEAARGALAVLEAEIAVHAEPRAEAAALMLEGARRSYPHGVHLMMRGAILLEQDGRTDEARAVLDRVLAMLRNRALTAPLNEAGPTATVSWRARSAAAMVKALIASGEEAEAAEIIEAAATDLKEVAEAALQSAAEAWFVRGDDARAEAAALRLTDLSPGWADGFILLARARLRSADLDGARAAARQALAIEGEHRPDANLLLARTAMARKDFAEAAARCETILDDNPARDDARQVLVRALLSSGAAERALGHARTAVETTPDVATNHATFAEALLALGRNDEAIAALQHARATLPASFPIVHVLARELSKAGRDAEAVPVARELVALRPDWAAGHVLLARVLGASGDRAGAVEAQRGAIALVPDDGSYHRLLARFLFDAGRLDEAARAAAEGVRLGDEPAAHLLARIDQRRGAANQRPSVRVA